MENWRKTKLFYVSVDVVLFSKDRYSHNDNEDFCTNDDEVQRIHGMKVVSLTVCLLLDVVKC